MTKFLEYADCSSAQHNGKTSFTSVLYMSIKNLMVVLQSWIFGKCIVPLNYNNSQVYSNPEREYLLGSIQLVK